MINKPFYICALCASVLLSCSRGELREVEKSREIVFTADGCGIVADVRTKAAAVTSLSSFNVNCVTGTPGSSEVSNFNVPFSGSTNYTGGMFWPSTDPGYKFYASNVSVTPAASGPTVAASNTTDVVCAVCLSPTYLASNSLTFNHIFARLGKTTVSVQSGYSLSAFSLSITPKTGGTYNLFSGNGKSDGTGWSATTNGAPVILATNSGENAATDTYLVPGNYILSATYTLTKGDYSITKSSVTKSVPITGGKINAISATLSGASASDITFTVSVAPWGDPVDVPVTFN